MFRMFLLAPTFARYQAAAESKRRSRNTSMLSQLTNAKDNRTLSETPINVRVGSRPSFNQTLPATWFYPAADIAVATRNGESRPVADFVAEVGSRAGLTLRSAFLRR